MEMQNYNFASSDITPSSEGQVHINVLPDELLVIIFEQGGRFTLGDIYNAVPLAILVAHVCKRWRQIAFDTPSVWRTVPIVNPSNLSLPKMFIDKSGLYPLDVFLHAKNLGTSTAMKTILMHSHRWRGLYIRVASAPLLFIVVSHLRNAIAPQLRRFELYIDAQPKSVGLLPAMFNGNPPKITSLRLEGGTCDFRSQLLCGLTNLTLARFPRGMGHPSHTTFRDILAASPRLLHLTLDGVLPRLALDIEYDEIEVPNLLSLTLTIPQGYEAVQQLFSVLVAPKLETMVYNSGWVTAFSMFDASLPVLAAKYASLRELHFTVAACTPLMGSTIDPYFFGAFPDLRSLVLNVFDDAHALYFIMPWIGVGDWVDGFLRDDIWPDFDLLMVRAPFDEGESGDVLCDSLDLLRSVRDSLGLPFDLLRGSIFGERFTEMRQIQHYEWVDVHHEGRGFP